MNSFTRRRLLCSAALTTAGLPLVSRCHGKDNVSALPLGFGTYGLPGYSITESIQLVERIGFDSIELVAMPRYHGSPEMLSASDRKEIREILSDSQLNLGALMGLPRPTSGDQTAATDQVKRMLQLAADLCPESPPLIQSVLGGKDWEKSKAMFRDAIGPWVELASTAGIQLSIKPHRGHAMDRPEHAVWIINQLNAKDKLSMVYDYSHYAYRDLSVEQTVGVALPYTGYLVVKDAAMIDGKVKFTLPGASGTMPHAEVLQRFYKGGYRGEVCCEVSSQVWRTEGYDPEQGARTAHENMKQICAEAGLQT